MSLEVETKKAETKMVEKDSMMVCELSVYKSICET